jgi:MFS family permease
MASSDVEATIKLFREQQLSATTDLFQAITFVTSLSEPSRQLSGNGDLAEFIACQLFGTLSDIYSRKRILLASLIGLVAARGTHFLVKATGKDSAIFETISSACVGGFLTTSRATLFDFSSDSVDISTSNIRLASAGAYGALCGPLFRGLVLRVFGRESAPLFASTVAALGSACAVLVLVDDADAEVQGKNDTPLLAYSPFAFVRLASSSTEASKALAVSFLMELSGGVVVREAFEQLIRQSSPLASSRLRFLLLSTIVTILGVRISLHLQKVVGLDDQASLASMAQVGMAVALVARRPYLAIAGMLLSCRGYDATDTYLMENRSDGAGRGETAGSLANWRALAAFLSPITVGYAQSKGGLNSVSALLIASALFAEHLRRDIRQKQWPAHA